jgi:hypothetical protein
MQKQPREHDALYLSRIREQPCCLCGNNIEVEAHHPRVGSIKDGRAAPGLGEKASDRWALPLCGRHHRELHACGNEGAWWASYGLDPAKLALRYQIKAAR